MNDFLCLSCEKRFPVAELSPAPTECPQCGSKLIEKITLRVGPTIAGMAFGLGITSLVLGPVVGLPAMALALAAIFQGRPEGKRAAIGALTGLAGTILISGLLIWAFLYQSQSAGRAKCMLNLTRIALAQAKHPCPITTTCPAYAVAEAQAAAEARAAAEANAATTRKAATSMVASTSASTRTGIPASMPAGPEASATNTSPASRHGASSTRASAPPLMPTSAPALMPTIAPASMPASAPASMPASAPAILSYQTNWPWTLAELGFEPNSPALECPESEESYFYMCPPTNAPPRAFAVVDTADSHAGKWGVGGSGRCVLRVNGDAEFIPEEQFQGELKSPANEMFAKGLAHFVATRAKAAKASENKAATSAPASAPSTRPATAPATGPAAAPSQAK